MRPEPFGALAYHFGNRRLTFLKRAELVAVVRALGRPARRPVRRWSPRASRRAAPGVRRPHSRGLADDRHDPPQREGWPRDHRRRNGPSRGTLVEQFELGLDAPICLTWELTYACNLECAHCLSARRRDPRELTTAQCEAVIDELQRMQVFYVNIGGGEPTIRPDFWHLLQYAVDHQVGVKFSTNGVRLTPERAAVPCGPACGYVDVQISLDGATAEVNDYVRGPGSYDIALTALQNLQDAGFQDAEDLAWSAPGRTSASSTSSRSWPTGSARRCV